MSTKRCINIYNVVLIRNKNGKKKLLIHTILWMNFKNISWAEEIRHKWSLNPQDKILKRGYVDREENEPNISSRVQSPLVLAFKSRRKWSKKRVWEETPRGIGGNQGLWVFRGGGSVICIHCCWASTGTGPHQVGALVTWQKLLRWGHREKRKWKCQFSRL